MPNEEYSKMANVDKINSSDLATPDSVEAITAAIFSTENTLCLTTESVQTTDSLTENQEKQGRRERTLSQFSTLKHCRRPRGLQCALLSSNSKRASRRQQGRRARAAAQ